MDSYCLFDSCRILQVGNWYLVSSTGFIVYRRLKKAFAIDLFRSVKDVIAIAPSVNIKGIMGTVSMMLQLAPAELWGEALHISGLFIDIVKALEEEKVMSTRTPCIPLRTTYIS